MFFYNVSALVKSVTDDLFHNLLAVYNPSYVYAIITIGTLKVIKPSVIASKMFVHYNHTFVCRDYSSMAMSKNSIGNLYQCIDMDENKQKKFYQLRRQTVEEIKSHRY